MSTPELARVDEDPIDARLSWWRQKREQQPPGYGNQRWTPTKVDICDGCSRMSAQYKQIQCDFSSTLPLEHPMYLSSWAQSVPAYVDGFAGGAYHMAYPVPGS